MGNHAYGWLEENRMVDRDVCEYRSNDFNATARAVELTVSENAG